MFAAVEESKIRLAATNIAVVFSAVELRHSDVGACWLGKSRAAVGRLRCRGGRRRVLVPRLLEEGVSHRNHARHYLWTEQNGSLPNAADTYHLDHGDIEDENVLGVGRRTVAVKAANGTLSGIGVRGQEQER